MNNKKMNHVKLGLFVVAGTVILIVTLYLLGSKHNLFGSTFRVSVVFRNVNGLMPGNNVRYGGINIGTVEEINIENDSTIKVVMLVEEDAKKFIGKNAIVSIGTDGLMGNKLLNINSSAVPSQRIQEGDILIARLPIETDDMMHTLNVTNDNLAVITTDLRSLTQKINKPDGLGNLLSNPDISGSVRTTIKEFQTTAENTRKISMEVAQMVHGVSSGKGVLGQLISDTATAGQVKVIMSHIAEAADTLVQITQQLEKFSEGLNDKNGMVYALSKDTSMTNDLKNTLDNINQSSYNLNENLKAMRSNALFRKYFKEEEKKRQEIKK